MELVVASNNAGKIREYRDILEPMGFQVFSQDEKQVHIEVEETGTTFEENALLKAQAVYDRTGCCVISDDSGLSVDALNGEPGIYSARYLGYDTDYNYKMEQIMKRMENVPEPARSARFVAAVAAIFPDGSEHVVLGAMEGLIAHGIYGKNGFGYDPFFYLPEYGKTSAEITEEEKNAISHRGKALRSMLHEFDEWRCENSGNEGGTL